MRSYVNDGDQILWILGTDFSMNDRTGPSQSDHSDGLSSGQRALPPGHFRSAPCATGPARLASLRTRDMTLIGAPKKPRRTFEPNVNVVRKSKDEIKGQIPTTPKQQRSEREEKRKERRGVKKEKPRIIQSHSIFEQGPAACSRKIGRGPTVPEPSSSLCDLLKREPEEDSHISLSKLYRDDFIDDPTLKNNSKLKPIQLPLCHIPSLNVNAQSAVGGRNLEVCETKQPSLVNLLSDLRLSDQEELFFMQLPDCMPIKTSGHRFPDTASPGPSRTATRDSKPQDKSRLPTRDSKLQDKVSANLHTQEPVLYGFSEGHLGKLQLRRSGKVVLKLGDISMDVTEGAAFSFLQQLVSVRQSEGRSGDMMVLGNVSHKLVLSPVFQTLLEQSETKSS